MKKAISVFLSVLMVISILPAFTAFAADSGNCGENGDNVKWKLEDSTLTIYGKGKMADLSDDKHWTDSLAPWSQKDFTKIIIKNGVTNVGSAAFSGNEKLSEVVLGDSIISIDTCAFYECKNLKEITLPDKVEKIYEYAFRKVPIEEINLPDSLKMIDDQAFSGSGLKSVVVPEGVTSVGTYAFMDCYNLDSIKLPSTLRNIGMSIVMNTPYAKNENNWRWNGLYVNHHLLDYDGRAINYKILKGTICIAEDAFWVTGAQIESIILPESLKAISERGFFGCKDLESINIPAGVEVIGVGAFNSCKRLEKFTVDKDNKFYDSRNNCNAIIETKTNKIIAGCSNTVIPKSVKAIGAHAFYLSKQYIEIPETVTRIEDYAYVTSRNNHVTVFFEGDYKQWKKARNIKSTRGATNVYFNCKRLRFSSAKGAKKKFTVKWNKLGSAKGYQIQYSTDRNFEKDVHKIKVKGNKTFKRTVKVKKAKKYYVRVRAYKTFTTDKVHTTYSVFSPVRTVTVKK